MAAGQESAGSGLKSIPSEHNAASRVHSRLLRFARWWKAQNSRYACSCDSYNNPIHFMTHYQTCESNPIEIAVVFLLVASWQGIAQRDWESPLDSGMEAQIPFKQTVNRP
jgi:hypothetical protein